MFDEPPEPRFARQILWQNESEQYLYSTGGSGCILNYLGNFYFVTAGHAIDKEHEGRLLTDSFIWQRIDSGWRLRFRGSAQFHPKEGTSGSSKNCDIQISEVLLNPNDEGGLQDVDVINIGNIQDVRYAIGRVYLIGYPKRSQLLDYDEGTSFHECTAIEGEIRDDHADDGVLRFYSPCIDGFDIDGMSGGPVASWGEDGWRLEGICIEGSGENKSLCAGFVGRRWLLSQLELFTKEIERRKQTR